jgi:hypothetical protein
MGGHITLLLTQESVIGYDKKFSKEKAGLSFEFGQQIGGRIQHFK